MSSHLTEEESLMLKRVVRNSSSFTLSSMNINEGSVIIVISEGQTFEVPLADALSYDDKAWTKLFSDREEE